MKNTISFIKKTTGQDDRTYYFRYDAGSEESLIVKALGDLIARDELNCFDAAFIRRDLEEAQKAVEKYC